MNFREALESGKFLVTTEVAPPKGTDVGHVLADAEIVQDRVDAINVTDLQSSVMRMGSLAVCHMLADKGTDPIYQVTCRDRNRLALQSDLLSAWALGIHNVLALTGDHPTMGDHPRSKPVFDLDSVALLKTVDILNSGYDLAGNELQGRPDFSRVPSLIPGQIMRRPWTCRSGNWPRRWKRGQSLFRPRGYMTWISLRNSCGGSRGSM